MTNIYNLLYKNRENNLTSRVLGTDLSAAYDTVNSGVLLNKLKHYGVEDGWNDLIGSFLVNRKQFVELDTKKSIVRNSLDCGTI